MQHYLTIALNPISFNRLSLLAKNNNEERVLFSFSLYVKGD